MIYFLNSQYKLLTFGLADRNSKAYYGVINEGGRAATLLISDKAKAVKGIKDSAIAGQSVPAQRLYIDSHYYKSAIMNEYGVGHSGWAGQLIWTDPESGTIIAINSMVQSDLPAPYDHFNKEYQAAFDVVKHLRAKAK